MKRAWYGMVLVATALGLAIAGAGTASATIQTQKKAKDAGYPATNCLYCHNEKLPKKGAATLNDRGTFLHAEKEKTKAKEVDVAWLKGYTEKK